MVIRAKMEAVTPKTSVRTSPGAIVLSTWLIFEKAVSQEQCLRGCGLMK